MSLLKLKTKTGSNHFQTPKSALEDIHWNLCLSPNDYHIWEPCNGKGNISSFFKTKGYKVTATDILTGDDFLQCTRPPSSDKQVCIITNPPYSEKDDFIEKCYELYMDYDIPFALLLPITALEGEYRQSLYRKYGLEVALPQGRVAYDTPSGKKSSPWFYSAWFCKGLFDTGLTFMERAEDSNERI